MFEELDRDVDDAIDDLVHSVLRRFGLSVSSEDVRAMKRAGCDEAATITVKDDVGKTGHGHVCGCDSENLPLIHAFISSSVLPFNHPFINGVWVPAF